MKTKSKRLFSILLAVMVAFCLFVSAPLAASALTISSSVLDKYASQTVKPLEPIIYVPYPYIDLELRKPL